MATDRDTALRKAEKLLRQGRLDQAIEEYVRIVEEHPHDLTSANALGDLCVRAGQVEQAVAQYARIAGYLAREGFLSKAAALYKKILKIRPLDEPTLLQAADIAARQGLLADARSYLTAVIDRRTARGDARGAAEIRVRLGGIDPGDVEASLAAARARAELGE
ncbi:MAG TPA: tetratricopeptide repeat protein, partial [Vicinamibacterales bacterium]|nr:tetratricopeptide repeat protein [Vicinamibacterales bacterium]